MEQKTLYLVENTSITLVRVARETEKTIVVVGRYSFEAPDKETRIPKSADLKATFEEAKELVLRRLASRHEELIRQAVKIEERIGKLTYAKAIGDLE